MRPRIPFLIAAVAMVATAQLFGATFSAGDRIVRELPIDEKGTIVIDNPFGSIDIIGAEGNSVSMTAERFVMSADATSLREAAESVTVLIGGDMKVRAFRTATNFVRPQRWTAVVNYVLRVPRSVSVKVLSKSAEHIRIAHIDGNVEVEGFTGTLIMDGNNGPSLTRMVNGRIIYDYPSRPTAKAQVEAVNADIDIYVPNDAAFNWTADTINGEILTTLPIRAARQTGTVFRGTVGNGGPMLSTVTAMGRVLLLARGTSAAQAQSVRGATTARKTAEPRPLQKVQLASVNGSWRFTASVADVSVGEVRGSAFVDNGAGQVELGSVLGQCNVVTKGGSLNFGDIVGLLTAHTGGGDVLVRAARSGGQLTTDGGLIRVIAAGGPLTLRSGGGDIFVRQASSSVDAVTSSGDITLTGDPAQRTLRVSAKTQQGNIILNVQPRFGADVDATILTSNPDANDIQSDFNGLTIRREQVGGKTRIRATGRINGGGERVELYAEEGDIHISAQVLSPIVLSTPR